MDAILGFLNNEVVLTFVVALFGLVIRFAPQAQGIPNRIIPYLNVLLALMIKLGAPAAAHADSLSFDTLSVADTTNAIDTVAIAAVGGFSFWGKLLSSVLQSLLNAMLFDKFIRPQAVR